MAKRHHRFVWGNLALPSPADADRDDASPAAVVSSAHGGAEIAAPYESSNGSENVTDEPARPEGLEADAGEKPLWAERFASPEEMWTALRNEQQVRGRLANVLGQARARIEVLEEQLEAFEQITFAQIELGKSRAVLGAGGRRIPAAGLEALLAGAGVRSEGSGLSEGGIPSPTAGGDAPQLPESPEAG